jgi:glycosyltransferase involved in cell wall biosynthesis
MIPAELERRSRLQRVAFVVPAWRPEAVLLALVEALAGSGAGAVVVVDDGSGDAFASVFASVAAVPGVKMLRHAENRGKGRALKTGFEYVLAELPEIDGVVTVDADGQHRAEDAVRVAEALGAAALVLGVRVLRRDAPLRSRVGNGLTRCVFARLTRVMVSDTQTGLRGYPRGMLRELLGLQGERYEYEMRVLVEVCRRQRPVEVPIATVYLDGNRGSHFAPVMDSLRIGWVLLRCGVASLGQGRSS